MPVTGADIVHEDNLSASQQVEIVVGSDNVVRINVDGVCALRVRYTEGTELRLEDCTGDPRRWLKHLDKEPYAAPEAEPGPVQLTAPPVRFTCTPLKDGERS